MRRPPKSVFVSIFIVITLIGMSLSMITNSQNNDLLEQETKCFSHTNVNFEGYQEDSMYTYSTLSSGGWTQCVISEDTRVVCWGNNAQGKRGLGGGIGTPLRPLQERLVLGLLVIYLVECLKFQPVLGPRAP